MSGLRIDILCFWALLPVVIRNVILVFFRSQNALVKRRGLLKSKRKKEIELEIPQAKNPSGVFQIGELYLFSCGDLHAIQVKWFVFFVPPSNQARM